MTDAFEPDATEPAAGDAAGYDDAGEWEYEDTDGPDGPDGPRKGLLIGGAVLVVLLMIGGIYLVTRDNGSPNVTSQDTLPGTTKPPPATATGPSTSRVSAGTTKAGTASTVPTTSTTTSSSSTSSTSQTSTTRAPTTSSSSASTTTTAGTKPTIASFSAPSTVTAAQCGDRGNTEIILSWDVKNATSVALSIDGAPYQSGLLPQASATVNYGCVQGQHTYTITAAGAGGASASETRTVTGPPKAGA